MQFEKEVMNHVFTKYHIIGLPFKAALHHFTGVIPDAIHDHPWPFTTYILSGGYVEKIYRIGIGRNNWRRHERFREPGTMHTVKAEHIHELAYLPTGECWTLVMQGQDERESRFWRFNDDGVFSRAWHEKDFIKHVI